jgi:two-component system OmpR family sensor kinase
MKPRLIWKILIAFWLTLALVGTGVYLGYVLPSRAIRGEGIDAERLRAAVVAQHYGGRPALDQVTGAWPADVRARLQVAANPRGEPGLSLQAPAAHPGIPLWPIGIQFLASLLFSAALGAYLARPIGRLRDGFRRLAEGDLTTRLTPGMGRRRDEIADLAQDFDAMAERLQQLIGSRDRLLHDVSHELRSPLARLSVAVGLARQNKTLTEQTLTRIEAESARLNAIVGDLLSLSRAESEAAAEDIYFDIAALLQVICDDARFEAQPLKVGIDLELSAALTDPERTPLITGAPELLRRAIENVIRNALRFSPPSRAVEVRASLVEGAVAIEVRDHGPGATPALLESMFDPFVKGPDEVRGVGLGLAIAQRALAAHKGELRAVNHVDGGLLVRLTVPVSPATQSVLSH